MQRTSNRTVGSRVEQSELLVITFHTHQERELFHQEIGQAQAPRKLVPF
jgi:hypothetical protein